MSVSRALSQLADALDEVVGDKVAEAIKESDALHDKVKEIINDTHVEADEISNLDDFIENWLDNHYTPTVEANNVDGLNSEIVDVVVDKLPDILSEQLGEAIREHKFDVDDIQGLDDHVTQLVENEVENVLVDKVDQAIDAKGALTAETLPEKLAQALGSPIFQAHLDLAVKQALLRIVSSLFAGLVPQATPVVPPSPPQP